MPLKLAPQRVSAERKGDVWYLSSPQELHEPPRRLGDLLRRAAARAPERDFLVERRTGVLHRTTWKQALEAAEGIADWLVREQPRDVRVASLSGNSVDLALLMLGCHLAGVPFVPISPAYSLLSQDFAKLRVVLDVVKPGVVFVDRPESFERAIERSGLRERATLLHDLRPLASRRAGGELRVRESEIQPDDVAKILFTSGSTGFPKGVLNTHRMLCSNQQMIAQCWPFLSEGQPPVLVDWLPWSHTFGGNHDFNMVLFHGGTLLVDEGRPTPAGIDATVANLRELPPTLYFNVPAGYAALVPKLESDDAFARAFFQRLDVMFYAAAALPPDLWKRLTTLAAKWSEREVFMTTAWGSTETSPMATSTHFHVPSAGNIGLPAPGVTLKLVPSGNKVEVRVKGPSVMPGYLDEPDLTRAAFDDEGFYLMGDAVKFVDPERPEAGIAFDGRVAEDFKLSSGTWVSVTHVRTGVVAKAGGLLTDVVVCGHDRESLGLLAWPSIVGCRAVVGGERALGELSTSETILRRVHEVLAAWNADNPGGSMKIVRVLLLSEPPSSDAGEITDKGYTNQHACLERRRADVEELFADPPSTRVLVLG
ncbi:Feruloyl-CoA synthetase [Labilithrix luteola]|uniref:Feruloyl-CoA synthetase n=1 Tax=Labilithrix luteola TaxID=1391654 RepID=A0A0K1PV28_9BACT|nr:feruloyl-CoA synthase [Labilithrix luteola]AKU97393.1 Feruloyl-CoA synthetase [Labilithrix luteola]